MKHHQPASKHVVESTVYTVLLQVIHIEWSKTARGGTLATARNQVPEAFPLTLPSSPAKEPFYLIHHRFYSEADHFEQPYYDAVEVTSVTERTHYISKRRRLHALFVAMPHTEVQSEVFGEETIGYDRIGLDWKVDRLIVDYHYTDGFPYSTPARFTLEPEQWARIRYNARYTVDAGWVYDKWVFNVGLFSRPDRNIFLTTAPSKLHSRLSQLW